MDVDPTKDSGFSSPSSHLRREFEDLLIAADANRNNSLAAVPFAWEERPGVPKAVATLFHDDFSFDVSRHFDTNPARLAEDLFQGGLIRTVDSSNQQERGRERGLPSSRSRRTRSLPPPGVLSEQRPQRMAPPSPVASTENGSRKWSFMDLFLFRSASDGRAMDADPLKKYSANFRKHDQDVRNSGSMSKRRGRLSAHELHYNVNRAVSNDMKKKTYLPYKHGILGRFSFNP
ncbi:hypothetical protein L1987_53352 [Smallanthus sonchifolius]|uniref:Uncharacterized protein n=1 Tax=Smallanthus sonchifolius TaxID=185202 RepID=A0ACB9EW06_9ASTR|nr:hypothetical protein L1987_53352 [Smallanthus sonchifolius]